MKSLTYISAALFAFAPGLLLAQGRGGAPPTAKAAAPADYTGYWVSQIVDEWRFRVVPQKGDIPYLPINAAARRVVQRPGRLNITWADDNTIKIDFDAGTQTRMLHFGAMMAATGEPTWQGYSHAEWEIPVVGRGARAAPLKGADTLKVVTTHMKPGYIRKNGVPYGDKAVLTEYFNKLTGANGEPYLAVTAFVDDPEYLNAPFIRTYVFKHENDGSKWDPTPCWNK
jgi:hypothetical protein